MLLSIRQTGFLSLLAEHIHIYVLVSPDFWVRTSPNRLSDSLGLGVSRLVGPILSLYSVRTTMTEQDYLEHTYQRLLSIRHRAAEEYRSQTSSTSPGHLLYHGRPRYIVVVRSPCHQAQASDLAYCRRDLGESQEIDGIGPLKEQVCLLNLGIFYVLVVVLLLFLSPLRKTADQCTSTLSNTTERHQCWV